MATTALDQHRQDNASSDSLKEILKTIKDSGVEYVYYQGVSITGRVLGKVMPARHFERVAGHGVQQHRTAAANLQSTREGVLLGGGVNAAEYTSVPDLDTFAVLPWDTSIARVFCRLYGHTHPLERPFIVLATQNPIEYEGTYPLPEAQLDRFLMRVSVGYPAKDDERRRPARARRTPGGCSRHAGRLRPGDVARAPAGGRGGARLRVDRLVHGRHRGGHARRPTDSGRCLTARVAGAAQARALSRRLSRAGTSSPPRT